MKKIAGCLLAAVIGLSGCGNDASIDRTNDNRFSSQGAFGPGPLNFEQKDDAWHEPELTNTGTSYKTPTYHQHTLEDDARQVVEVIHDQGFDAGFPFLNGGQVYVKVYPKESWDEQETEQQMMQLKTALKRVIPRYDVHVRR